MTRRDTMPEQSKKRTAVWNDALKSADETGAVKDLHEFVIEDLKNFDARTLRARRLNPHIWKIVALHKDGGFRTHAFGFDGTAYDAAKAKATLASLVPGLAGPPQPETVKLAARYQHREYTDEEGNELVDILAVEVMKVGIWNDIAYTPDEIQEVLDADAELHELLTPPLKETHEGRDAFGWPGLLKKVGNALFCDIMRVPKRVWTEIVAGRWNRLSPEFDRHYTEPTTEKFYNRVFTGLALLGADHPAATSMPGLIRLAAKNECEHEYPYISKEAMRVQHSVIQFETKKSDDDNGGDEMSDKEKLEALEKKVGEDQAALKVEREKLDAQVAAMKTDKIANTVQLLVAANKVDPDKIEELKEIAASIPDDDTVKFKDHLEKEREGSSLDRFLDIQHRNPVAKTKETGGTGAPEGTPTDELPVHEQIQAMMREEMKADEGITDSEALVRAERRIRTDNPDLLKKYTEECMPVVMTAGNK